MTSDAKIGLLLGLVFIFVIAFIINGLPNLKPQQATHADVPIVVGFPDQQGMGILGQAGGEDAQDANPVGDGQEPVVASPSPVDQSAPAMMQTPSPEAQVAGNQDVRYETFLPGGNIAPQKSEDPQPRMDNAFARIGTLLNRFTAGAQGQTTSTFDMSSEQPAATVEPQPAVQMPQPRADVRPAETAARAPEQSSPVAASPAKTVSTPKPIVGKIYTVGEGESLSTVAKNVYGAEEGNRYVNINRIYEANKDILKSVNEVVAGQKLVIPSLPQRVLDLNKPSDVLPQELFERLEPLKRRVVQTPTTSAAGRWYTVQDGDNLWKIAASQLGAGARYEEIAKLNADLLKDKAVLDVGMKILLPTK